MALFRLPQAASRGKRDERGFLLLYFNLPLPPIQSEWTEEGQLSTKWVFLMPRPLFLLFFCSALTARPNSLGLACGIPSSRQGMHTNKDTTHDRQDNPNDRCVVWTVRTKKHTSWGWPLCPFIQEQLNTVTNVFCDFFCFALTFVGWRTPLVVCMYEYCMGKHGKSRKQRERKKKTDYPGWVYFLSFFGLLPENHQKQTKNKKCACSYFTTIPAVWQIAHDIYQDFFDLMSFVISQTWSSLVTEEAWIRAFETYKYQSHFDLVFYCFCHPSYEPTLAPLDGNWRKHALMALGSIGVSLDVVLSEQEQEPFVVTRKPPFPSFFLPSHRITASFYSFHYLPFTTRSPFLLLILLVLMCPYFALSCTVA